MYPLPYSTIQVPAVHCTEVASPTECTMVSPAKPNPVTRLNFLKASHYENYHHKLKGYSKVPHNLISYLLLCGVHVWCRFSARYIENQNADYVTKKSNYVKLCKTGARAQGGIAGCRRAGSSNTLATEQVIDPPSTCVSFASNSTGKPVGAVKIIMGQFLLYHMSTKDRHY